MVGERVISDTEQSNESEEILKNFLYENKELEHLEDIVDHFNIFVALDIKDNELKHSVFLSWLLDPSETHGLGDYFLKIFLRKPLSKPPKLK